MAVPSENPIVAANLPLVLSRPLGSDSSTEALRTALMGVAAIHQSYLLARGGATPDGAEEMMLIAQQYRMKSKKHLMKACSTVEGTRSDASLAAALAITLMDVSVVSVFLGLLRLSSTWSSDFLRWSKLVKKYGFGQELGTTAWWSWSSARPQYPRKPWSR